MVVATNIRDEGCPQISVAAADTGGFVSPLGISEGWMPKRKVRCMKYIGKTGLFEQVSMQDAQ